MSGDSVSFDESGRQTPTATRYGGEDEPPLGLADLFDESGAAGRVGHYLLLTKLGHGGMGVVFSAYDERLDRKVAIKFLRREPGPEGRRRLTREAQAMARISHTNVVQIHEIGEHRGLTFIVMQYLEGRTLRAWITEAQPTRADIIAALVGAGRGLAAAHARGVVHRDFKPDNVMISDTGQVWVLDFGLAREASGVALDPEEFTTSELSSDLTRTGSLLGTPVYMSPEQFAGAAIDSFSDQFGFCVVLWEALYGQRPFPGDSFEKLADAVTQGNKREPRSKDVPAWLRAVLDRGLQVAPARRWPSMDALLDALEHDPSARRRRRTLALASVALLAVGVTAALGYQTKQRDEIDASCVAAGQAIFTDWNDARATELEASFAATGLGMAASTWDRSRAPIQQYVEDWAALRTELCRATELRGEREPSESAQILACLDARRAGLSALLEAWQQLDEASLVGAPIAANALAPPSTCLEPEWLAQALRPPAELREQVEALRSRIERTLALERATKLSAAQSEATALLSEAETLGWQPLVAEARLRLGQIQASAGNYDEAQASLKLASLEATGSAHDLATLDAASSLIALLGEQLHNPADGRYWGELAARYVERLELRGSVREANLLNNRGLLLSSAGEYGDALALFRAALAIREAKLGPAHPLTAQSLNNVGDVLHSLAEYEEALRTHERALDINREALGPEHPNVAFSLNNIANIYQAQGRYGESLVTLREALRIREAALGPLHPRLITVLNNIGNNLWRLGEYEQAIATYERGIEIVEATRGPDDPQIGMLMVGIGITRLSQGHAEQALAAHRRGLELLEPALGPKHAHIATMHVNIGDALIRLGRYQEALGEHQTALQLGEATFSPEHESLAYSLLGIGLAQEGLGELGEARVALERALALREQSGGAPDTRADVRFVLGRVRWAAGEHEQGRSMVELARAEFRRAEGHTEGLDELEAWLAAHPR